jgi:hypothetical protein
MRFCVSLAENFFCAIWLQPANCIQRLNDAVGASVDAGVVASHAVSVMQALSVAGVARQ